MKKSHTELIVTVVIVGGIAFVLYGIYSAIKAGLTDIWDILTYPFKLIGQIFSQYSGQVSAAGEDVENDIDTGNVANLVPDTETYGSETGQFF